MAREIAKQGIVASMEPRSFDHGKSEVDGGRLVVTMLQWSRDHLITERLIAKGTLTARSRLQWSRDHLITERIISADELLISGVLQWSRDHLITERSPL